jgi:hypothetical protein
MFTYCLNNAPNSVDNDGRRRWRSTIIANRRERKTEEAEEKYNSETIHIYVEGAGSPVDGKLNVMMRPSENVIQIQESWEITNSYEKKAIMKTVMNHELYSSEIYLTDKSQGYLEWRGHNGMHTVMKALPFVEDIFAHFGQEDAYNRSASVDLDRELSFGYKLAFRLFSFFEF